jgi:hypothetical protein
MKLAALSLTLFFAASASAQLGNQFSTAALKAVRTINRMTEAPSQDADLTLPQYVAEAVNQADDLGRTKAESKMVAILAEFARDKVYNNISRELIVSQLLLYRTQSAGGYSSGDARQEMEAALREHALAVPAVREMSDREDACASALARTIRAGVAVKPVPCRAVWMEVNFEQTESDLEQPLRIASAKQQAEDDRKRQAEDERQRAAAEAALAKQRNAEDDLEARCSQYGAVAQSRWPSECVSLVTRCRHWADSPVEAWPHECAIMSPELRRAVASGH